MVVFVLMGAFVILDESVPVIRICGTIFCTFYIFYFIYVALNRIKEISLFEGTISINRFLLCSLTFRGDDIKFISKDTVKIGKKSFNIKFVNNKSELITLLLHAMEVKNTDEAANGILSGVHLYKNKEDITKAAKRTHRNLKVALIILITLMGVGLIASALSNHWGIIYLVCVIIFIVLGCAMSSVFENRINIKSKFLNLIFKGVIYLLCIVFTVVLGIIIYKVFMIWNIDLIKITF